MLIGHSSRLGYDNCYYPDRLSESTSPMAYRLSENNMYNCKHCLPNYGPYGMSKSPAISRIPVKNARGVAVSQDLADLESILTNRNVKESKCKNGKVNPINVTKFSLQHGTKCSRFLDPTYSRLDYPVANYRDLATNRFYNLPKDPQVPIFWDFSINTKLEEKDNFTPKLPKMWSAKGVLPHEYKTFKILRKPKI